MKRVWGLPALVVLVVFFSVAARHAGPPAPLPVPTSREGLSPLARQGGQAAQPVQGGAARGAAPAPGDPDDCLACHDDDTFTMERDGKEISLYIDPAAYAASPHGALDCLACHEGFDPDEEPHREDIQPVDCAACHEKAGAAFQRGAHATAEGVSCKSCHETVAHRPQPRTSAALAQTCRACHEEAVDTFERSLHGQALQRGRSLAPTCVTCHGNHDLLPNADPKARTYVMNIPSLCGSCHKEGTTVSQLRTMGDDERHVLEDYTESIHGEGLLKRGLIVTAVCTSCHTAHDILPHENPASSIHRENIPETCMQCHTRVEEVHVKVINGELWEKKPHQVPVCLDCHKTHVVQRVFYERSFPDSYCQACHARPDLARVEDDGTAVSLFVDSTAVAHSAHRDLPCVKCHTDVDIGRDPVCVDSGPVDCSMCHAEAVTDFAGSAHGQALTAGNQDAPACTTCHGTHGIQTRAALSSPTFPRNIPALCARCHRDGEPAAVAIEGGEAHLVEHYTESIHGKGLLESGLLVTATCADCHTAHRELPADDPASTVSRDSVSTTCATCHLGVYEVFRQSVHSPEVTQTDRPLPTCYDCHRSHTIDRVDKDAFRQDILDQCGRCHEAVTETYFDTFHGKVSRLGSARTARCYDCHGAHNMLPPDDPASTLSAANRVETCRACHPGSNPRFAAYLAHARHDDPEAHPHLFYTFWAMTGLLVSVFVFFGAHTLLWFPRELKAWRQQQRRTPNLNPDAPDGNA